MVLRQLLPHYLADPSYHETSSSTTKRLTVNDELNPDQEKLVDQFRQVLTTYCQAPAPLVVNGGLFAGCSLAEGHEGEHQVKISWPRS